MADKLVMEKQICAACGADVRPQALFCYNCGARVAEAEAVQNGRDDAQTLSDDIGAKTTKLSETDLPIAKPSSDPFEKKEVEPAKRRKPSRQIEKLKTAASMRPKTRVRSFQKKKVEVVWEEPEPSPNLWFLIAAGVFTVLALVILWIMLLIK
jgi:hypothetical protein